MSKEIYVWSTDDIDSVIEADGFNIDPADLDSIASDCEQHLNNWDALNEMVWYTIYDIVRSYAKENEDE